jgi:cysteinyl-tRNA synthetase
LAAGQFLGLLAADADWWQPKQASDNTKVRIEALLTSRSQAKAYRDFAKADRVRAQLEAAGIEVVDKPDGQSEAVITEAFDPDLLG